MLVRYAQLSQETESSIFCLYTKLEKNAFTVSPGDNMLIYSVPVWMESVHTPFTRSQALWSGEKVKNENFVDYSFI